MGLLKILGFSRDRVPAYLNCEKTYYDEELGKSLDRQYADKYEPEETDSGVSCFDPTPLNRGEKDLVQQIRNEGVDEDFVPDTVAHKMNAAGAKPWNAKSKLVYAIHRLARRFQLNRLSSKIDQFNQKALPQMSTDTRNRLIEDVYGEHVKRLEKILDIDLQHWRT